MKADDVKSRLSREDILTILTRYGYEVSTRDFKFRLRDEKTPSAVINQDGTIHDYGADFHGDILDVLQEYQRLSFTDALEVLKAYIGVGGDVIVPPRASIEPKKEYVSTLSEEVHSKMVKYINELDNCEKQYQTFKFEQYKNEALAITPLWVWQQASKEAIDLFKSVTTYDNRNHTLIGKIHDYEGKLISYKRRRYGKSGKWITAKDTHPNKQCLVSIKNDGLNVYVVEGIHDYLTAILLGLNVVAIPTVNYQKFTEHELSLFIGRDLILIADYDFKNDSGIRCMQNLANQVNEISNATKVFNLVKFLENENISFSGNKLDLSEVVELWTDGLEAFISTLEFRADKDIFYIGEIF